MSEKKTKESGKSTSRIVRAAIRIFGKSGYRGASMTEVAQEAGVSKGLLHYHFHTKERLLIEAQRATFREIYRRFSERAEEGRQGLGAAVEVLDNLWASVRDLREGAPLIVETLSLAGQKNNLRKPLKSFTTESTALLNAGIHKVFQEQLDQLTIPPERMAVLIRILLEGLIVELAQAHTPEELSEIDQAYRDLRELFQKFVLSPVGQHTGELKEKSSVPLPW